MRSRIRGESLTRASTEPRFESRREREFYRYYEPIRNLSVDGPRLCDLNDGAAVKAHKPLLSPDLALTALCQLAALRLNAQRAMMFFFDSHFGYVLAEATKTISLQDASTHAQGDGLWMGHSILPRGCAVCEHTVNLPSTGQSVYGNTIHIINDLREDARFSDRPFVVEEPKARFYAGVPITTTKGVNIGAFCILDGKPRDGLDDVDITFLGDMAETIMSHLDMVRAKAEYGRSTQMVAGLGAFVDGNLREQDESSSSQVPSPPSSNSARKTSAEDSTRLTASDDSSHLPESQPSTPKGRSVPVQQPPESPSVAGIGAPISPPLPSGPGHTNDTKTFSSQSGDLRAQLITPDVQTTFQRAARIIRDAVDVDGAAFFDASIGTYGGLLDTSEEDSSGHSGFASSEPETSNIAGNRHNRRRQSVFGVERTHCPVLGFSGAPSGVDTENADPRSPNCPSFTERFLRSLLRRHPHGKIWNFDDQGNSSSDDEPSEDSVREKPNQEILDSLQDNGTDETFQRRRRKERSRVDHGRKIQQYFPGVRSFALVGMWDQLKGRWFSACAIWTYSPLRLLSSEGEVNFVAAFCDVIMAEVHRLESRDSDLAKTDFISSISHELRSPLHGILGSVDCLQEHECDEFSRTLVSQIEICGRTLLDIVNHLLDFSKIQQYTRKPSSQVDSSHDRRESLSTVRNTASHGGPRSLSFDVSLGALTEEVVEAAVYSFCSSKDQRTVLDRKVTVTLDIDCSSTVDWRCRIATGGWRRLCINLVSNALKYTTVGHVRISLSSIPAPYPTKAFNAVLKVMDSGCGMSEAFMQNDLFRAFVQEDSLAEGTGLGMSLVARIAKAMGGKVDVQSAKGSGTTVIVTVPVDHPRHDKDRIETQQQVHRSDLHDLSVGIIDFAHTNYSESIGYHPLAEEGNLLLYASLQKTFSELGLEVCKVTPADLRVANIHIITESTLIQWRESQSELDHDRLSEEQAMAALAGRALMVLCGTVASERLLRSSPPKFLRRTHVEFITQPVGPDRLVKSIQACLAALAKECKTSYEKSPAITKVPSHIGVVWGEQRSPESAAPWPLQLNGRITPPLEPNRRDGNDESSPTFVAKNVLTGLPERRRISARGSQPSRTAGVSCFQASEDANGLGRARSTSREHHGAQPVASEQLQPRKALLVVDDNDVNLKVLVTYAKKHGYQPLIARDGLQAFEVYKAASLGFSEVHHSSSLPENVQNSPQTPKVILMDINMPLLDGFEATRRIRQFEKQENILPAFVIALTGLGTAAAQQEAYTSGMNLFLTKPVRLKELTQILDAI